MPAVPYSNTRIIRADTVFEAFRKEQDFDISDQELLTGIKDWYNAAKKTGNFCLKSKLVDPYPKSRHMRLNPVYYFRISK